VRRLAGGRLAYDVNHDHGPKWAVYGQNDP
jgi:hypothetical protein